MQPLDLVDELPLGAAHVGDGFHQQKDAVHVGHALLHHVHHVVPQAVGRLVEAGGVHEDELTVPTGENGADAVAGGLGLVADDGDLLPHQGVGQGGLTHVGAAADGDDTAALDLHRFLHRRLQGPVQLLVPGIPGDPQTLQDGLLPSPHLGLLGAFVQVVIAQQVEDGVDRQIGELPLDAVAELLGLGLGPLHGDDHVPQGAQAGLRVQFILPLAGGRHAGGKLQHGEGEHVGGRVDLPLLQVDLPDPLVGGQQHVHPAGDGNLLRLQSGGDDPGQQGFVRIGAVQLPVDVDIMVFHFVLPLRWRFYHNAYGTKPNPLRSKAFNAAWLCSGARDFGPLTKIPCTARWSEKRSNCAADAPRINRKAVDSVDMIGTAHFLPCSLRL